MSKLVVILGAGASADFGVPTLSQLFKEPYAKAYLQKNTWLASHLNDIFWQPRGYDVNSSDKSLTVEEMLTILRDWEREKTVAQKLSPEDAAKFRKGIYVLIYHALFFQKSSSGRFLNPLIEFAGREFQHTTWASFNWDCVFEASFWYASGPPVPQGSRRNPSLAIKLNGWWGTTGRHTYLKLHGSLNWWLIKDQLTYVSFSGSGGLQAQWAAYESEDMPSCHPVILEPSYYKYNDDAVFKQLRPQWDFFLKELVEADYVLVIGYSLPSADGEARCKMLTAFQANTKALWGVVDPSESTRSNYERLFGSKRLQTFGGNLVAFNNNFALNFHQLFPTFTPKPKPSLPTSPPPLTKNVP